ncbi:MAG TPA: DUF1579 domain-containing protein [Ktedonobacterales bacterium]|jgi:hypothetical protein
MTEQAYVAAPPDGRADFDFFIGSWDSHQRKLKQRLRGCDEWEVFHGVSVARKLLGGLGNMDEVTMETAAGRVLGLTLRFFDPQTQLWSIYWSSSARSALDAPMVGRFEQGRGEFYDRETFDGRSIFSRFIWTSSGANACRWEQAFSADGGRTWETNWTADFTRREPQEQTHA